VTNLWCLLFFSNAEQKEKTKPLKKSDEEKQATPEDVMENAKNEVWIILLPLGKNNAEQNAIMQKCRINKCEFISNFVFLCKSYGYLSTIYEVSNNKM